jgi:hypothetical protein
MKFVKVKHLQINLEEILYIKRMENHCEYKERTNRIEYFYTVFFKSGAWLDISLEEYLILDDILFKESYNGGEA